jgi:hypothetical protein
MSEEIRALVDRRWDEYGIGVDAAQNGTRNRGRTLNLSRAKRRTK